MMMRNTLIALIFLLAPTWALAEIIIENAWVRLPPPVADTAAGYMTIHNSGDQDVEIISVKSKAADHPEFHAMEMHDGMMHMQKMDKVIVPAHGGISFDPGGNHLMLTGLTRELKAGEYLMIKLETSNGKSLMIHAEVRDMRSKSNEKHESHGHHGAH